MDVCITPKFCDEIIMPSTIICESGAFGKLLGLEDGALMNGISALIKGESSSFVISAMWIQWKDSHLGTRKQALIRHQLQGNIDLGISNL